MVVTPQAEEKTIVSAQVPTVTRDELELAEKLETAYDRETKVLALTIDDREAILRAVEDCPDGLAELRSVLEHEWRVREGL